MSFVSRVGENYDTRIMIEDFDVYDKRASRQGSSKFEQYTKFLNENLGEIWTHGRMYTSYSMVKHIIRADILRVT